MTIIRILDSESTGLERTDRLVELAYVDVSVEERRIVDFADALINPGIVIPPEAKAVHHITEEDVSEAAPAEEILAMYSGASLFAAHNAAFDRQFIPYPGDWICTWKVSLRVWPDAPRHSNQVLRYWRDFPVDPLVKNMAPHRALADALVTAGLVIDLLSVVSVEDMIKFTSEPALLSKISFGKHAGKKWSEVPPDYLHWVLGTDMDEDRKFTARYWLQKAGKLP